MCNVYLLVHVCIVLAKWKKEFFFLLLMSSASSWLRCRWCALLYINLHPLRVTQQVTILQCSHSLTNTASNKEVPFPISFLFFSLILCVWAAIATAAAAAVFWATEHIFINHVKGIKSYIFFSPNISHSESRLPPQLCSASYPSSTSTHPNTQWDLDFFLQCLFYLCFPHFFFIFRYFFPLVRWCWLW